MPCRPRSQWASILVGFVEVLHFLRASLLLCKTWHGLWDGVPGFRAAHPKLPALSGLFFRMRYASCIIFVSLGSCSDSSGNFICEASAGALYFFTRASNAAYSITGAGAADGWCWSHVFIYRSRRRVGDGRLSIHDDRSWCCIGGGKCWSNVFNRWSRRRTGDGRLRIHDYGSWCCKGSGGCWRHTFIRWSWRRIGDGRLRIYNHKGWCCIGGGG